jgi:hypothetical protein
MSRRANEINLGRDRTIYKTGDLFKNSRGERVFDYNRE